LAIKNQLLWNDYGDWHIIDELKKSYGQIPLEKISEIIN